MIQLILSKSLYEKDDKKYFSVLLGNGNKVNVNEDEYSNIKVGDQVFVSSQKLKTKKGKYFTLTSLVPVQIG